MTTPPSQPQHPPNYTTQPHHPTTPSPHHPTTPPNYTQFSWTSPVNGGTTYSKQRMSKLPLRSYGATNEPINQTTPILTSLLLLPPLPEALEPLEAVSSLRMRGDDVSCLRFLSLPLPFFRGDLSPLTGDIWTGGSGGECVDWGLLCFFEINCLTKYFNKLFVQGY